MRSTFRILFLLRKTLNKEGLNNLMVRLTIEKDRLEFSSKILVHLKDWDSHSGKLKGRSKNALEINNTIDFIRNRLVQLYQEIQEADGFVTVEKLRNRFLGVEERADTLLSLFDKKIAQKQSIAGISIRQEAVDKYVCTRSKVSEFISHYYKRSDMPIKELWYDFITNFELFLQSQYKCKHNTIVRHMRYLKQVTTDALKSRKIVADPFYGITFSSRRGDREYLTEIELMTIMNKEFSSKQLEEVRDIFIFCCFTGLAYVDVSRLTTLDIITKGEGERYIIKDRTKTGVQSYIPLLDIPLMILDKYKGRELPNGRLLPVCACQNMNIYIKEIAVLCGINKKLSTHLARHKQSPYQLLINKLHSLRLEIGNDLETSLLLRYA